MSNKQPQRLDAAAFAAWTGGDAQALPSTFCGVTQDSRRITPGCLYVALRGERFDGHDFVAQALRDGAAAALVETAWSAPSGSSGWPLIRVKDTRQALADAARAWRRLNRAFILGITGSSGKTTTKEMAAALFAAGGRVCATRGNLNNEVGLPLSLLAMPPETEYGIFELGSNHPGEIGRLSDTLQPCAAVITSIGCAHIEHFGTQEAIVREKGALLRALPHGGFAVLNREITGFAQLAEQSGAPVVTVTLTGGGADFSAEATDLQTGALRITEQATGEETRLCSGLPGAHNASNLLLAFAAARRAGLPACALAQALSGLTLPKMRWEVMVRDGVTWVNDAYNANPQSMAAALKTFAELPCRGRRIVVLGDMLELGEHTEALHREVGRCVAQTAPDRLLTVGHDAKLYLAEEAVRAGFPQTKVVCADDARAAGIVLCEWIRSGDSVLLKASRGMRLEGIVGHEQV
ncbi:MAG TPA: UDP-N-acetylmuramoyl-tripeptide--D-alanyl-D-alanine ligase [Kiritimatiellia bacterium]|nr:UDP-N-acetylmuramoyl-tripeptide--D-alanyl-D-alanine ligase [Kiritimatiellia bacterium]HOR97685.1 UDP-N-acetylmuramoyl-tripeptide--D-alanyl-D-alanine ligase [Kiritimatiellia bacterium]HPK37456.1 UDP-N-acetylmuramoyl-tripeptide--D-alanyl-D-alanine ligase [Kiritimatiellia bacterium]